MLMDSFCADIHPCGPKAATAVAGGEGIIADIEEEEAVKKALILRGDQARA